LVKLTGDTASYLDNTVYFINSRQIASSNLDQLNWLLCNLSFMLYRCWSAILKLHYIDAVIQDFEVFTSGDDITDVKTYRLVSLP